MPSLPLKTSMFKTQMRKLQGPKIVFHTTDSLESDEGVHNNIPEEFLCTINPASLPLSELKVKIGCPLMLL